MEASGRLWLLLAATILAIAGGASIWMMAGPGETPAPTVAAAPPPKPPPFEPPKAETPAPVASAPASAPTPAPAPASPPVPPPTAVPAPPPLPTANPQPATVVDSSERGYPLSIWRVGQSVGGWIDAPTFGDKPLDDQAVVEITGWAGDGEVGWRARSVAIAICGTVVATAKVDLPRPEVARNAHPNLGQSGWRARLAVAHLPRCTEPRLQALAQIGSTRAALPLMGSRPIALAPAGGPRPTLLAPPSPAMPPDADPPTRPISLSGNTNVRRCADAQCDIRGRLPGGTHRAIIGEETAGWLLVAVPAAGGLTGWISKQTLAGRR